MARYERPMMNFLACAALPALTACGGGSGSSNGAGNIGGGSSGNLEATNAMFTQPGMSTVTP